MVRSTELTRFRLAPNPGPMSLHGTNSYVIAAPGAAGTVVVDPGPAGRAAPAGTGRGRRRRAHPDHAPARGPHRRRRPVRRTHRRTRPRHGSRPTATAAAPLPDGEVIHAAGAEIRVAGHAGPHLGLGLLPPARTTAPHGSVLTGDTILGLGTTVLDYPDGTLGDYLASLDRLERLGAGHRPARPTGPCCRPWTRSSAPTGTTARTASRRSAPPSTDLGAGAEVAEVADAVYAAVDPAVRPAAELSVAAQLHYLRSWHLSRQRAASRAAGDGTLGAMRIARFVVDSDPLYGIVEGEPGSEEVTVINGDPFFHGVERTAVRHKLEDVRLLAPIIPRSKVIGVGRNFVEHAQELGNEVPAAAAAVPEAQHLRDRAQRSRSSCRSSPRKCPSRPSSAS